MHELTELELYNAIGYAKSIDEDAGRKIIKSFQLGRNHLRHISMVIAEKDQDMAHLLMELCFHVICVFWNAFGPLPSLTDINVDWAEKQALLLDTELQSMMDDKPMEPKFRDKLQDRFYDRIVDSHKTGFVKFINATIDDFASENPSRVPDIQIT